MSGGAAADSADLAVDAAAPQDGVEVFNPALFAQYRPETAADIINRLPGFSVNEGDGGRGLSGAQGNLLINGRRPPVRGGSIWSRLRAIPVEDVIRLELIEAGARDVDMQGYALLANLVVRERATRRWSARLEGETREDGGEAWELDLSGAMSGGWLDLEGTLEGRDNQYIDQANIRTSTADSPIARIAAPEDGHWSRRYFQSIAATQVGEAGELTLTGSGWTETREVSPLDTNAGDAQFTQSEDEERTERTVSAEYRTPLLAGLDWVSLISVSQREDEETESLTEAGRLSTASELSEAGEQALRSTLRWRASETMTFEGGGTWAFNYLEGVSSATVDGVAQNIDGSDARVEETRAALLGTLSWTPHSDVTASFGGRVEQFSLTSSNAGDEELSLTDIIPRASVTWNLPRDWVLRLRSEREVGQLNLGQFLASTDLGSSVSTSGALTLEPQRDWTHELTLERRFDERGLVRMILRAREVDNPVSSVPDENGDVRPVNIGPETIETAEGEFELPLDRWGFEGALLDGWFRLRRSERIDPLQGFTRTTSGHRDYQWRFGLRHEIDNAQYVYGIDLEQSAPATHYWLTEIRREEEGLEARLYGEWRINPDWRSGASIRFAEDFERTAEVYADVRSEGENPLLVNEIKREAGEWLQFWSEWELREEVIFRVAVRSGRDRSGSSLVERFGGDFLDFAQLYNDAVPEMSMELRFNR